MAQSQNEFITHKQINTHHLQCRDVKPSSKTNLRKSLFLLQEARIIQIAQIQVWIDPHPRQVDVPEVDGVLEQPLGATGALTLVDRNAEVDVAGGVGPIGAILSRSGEGASVLVRAGNAARICGANIQWLTWNSENYNDAFIKNCNDEKSLVK